MKLRQILVRTDHNVLKWLQNFMGARRISGKVGGETGGVWYLGWALSRTHNTLMLMLYHISHAINVVRPLEKNHVMTQHMPQSDPDLKQMMEWLGTNTMPYKCQLDKSHISYKMTVAPECKISVLVVDVVLREPFTGLVSLCQLLHLCKRQESF